MDKKLPEITEAIEGGGGLLTAIEVLEVEDDLAAISDNEVKEGFQNILAARRVLRSIGELPKSLVEDLRSALNAREEVGERKPVSSARSEEHTSELQSHSDLVCRLLLEKKKQEDKQDQPHEIDDDAQRTGDEPLDLHSPAAGRARRGIATPCFLRSPREQSAPLPRPLMS